MEPENDRPASEHDISSDALPQQDPAALSPTNPAAPIEPVMQAEQQGSQRGMAWVFMGTHGLRAGWSTVIFLVLFIALVAGYGFVFATLGLVSKHGGFSPSNAFFGELFQVLALVTAAAIVAAIERKSILDYYLRGPNRVTHFFVGIIVGFLALSALVGALKWGGWLNFGSVSLQGSRIVEFGMIWAGVFLLVGCMEEGMMRCFLQATFTRGINFWWAAGTIAVVCTIIFFADRGNGRWGVYIIALLGLAPCMLLHINRAASSGFWQASWATSTLFGALHTGNGGENWIGIFAAAFIGFVFCVSIWVTGSAWWAIGCHASWDWAETYFYGTANSGMVATGHLFSTSPMGNPLWSGGTDGPEGSLLIIPVVLLLLALLLLAYRRPKPVAVPAPAQELAS